MGAILLKLCRHKRNLATDLETLRQHTWNVSGTYNS